MILRIREHLFKVNRVNKYKSRKIFPDRDPIGTIIPARDAKKIVAEYTDLVMEAILNGYEWEFPGLGTIKMIKALTKPKLTSNRRKYFKANGEYYKLMFDCKSKANQGKVECTIAYSLREKMKSWIEDKTIEYRVL